MQLGYCENGDEWFINRGAEMLLANKNENRRKQICEELRMFVK